MTELLRLKESGKALVSEEFLEGEEDLNESDLEPYLKKTGIEVDLSRLDEAIKEILQSGEFDGRKSEIGAELAPVIHRNIDITRRKAAIDGIWHYLTLVRYPEFVRYRWSSKMREKFLEGGEDIYSNAIHRLWWIAEISRDGDDYGRTESMLGQQELANDIADRWFGRHKPVTHACIDLLEKEEVERFEPANTDIISDTTTQLRENLTVVCAESLDYEQAYSLVEETREGVLEELR
ncbi:DUF6339 family protein [Halobaculum sp. D14]|uniref:DUF6339 family protein n=1 Tax=Halobaculum sp. D14 TaxID=3421642 RepID=UPI003EBBAB84